MGNGTSRNAVAIKPVKTSQLLGRKLRGCYCYCTFGAMAQETRSHVRTIGERDRAGRRSDSGARSRGKSQHRCVAGLVSRWGRGGGFATGIDRAVLTARGGWVLHGSFGDEWE